MTTAPSPRPRALAGLVPGEPLWIDLKGLLLSARCDLWHDPEPGGGFVAASWDFPFAALWGHPSRSVIVTAVSEARALHDGTPWASEWQLLAAPENRPLVAAALPSWRRRGIAVHRWEGSLEEPSLGAGIDVLLLPDGHREHDLVFDQFPAATRHELALDWVAARPMAVARAASRPVSCCYAAFTSEHLWDVSVETTERFRRRGLAAGCFLTLATHMAERGLTPAWGARLDNPASLGLAATLGFVRDALLDGWEDPA